MDRPRYQAGDLLTFEVTVKNVGSESLLIPVSVDLANLQAENPAEQFSYSELDISLWDALSDKFSLGLVSLRLYGDQNHGNTTIILHPGEWARIRGKDRIQPIVERIHSGTIDYSYPQTNLSHCETLLTATSMATSCREVCVEQRHGKSAPVAVAVSEE